MFERFLIAIVLLVSVAGLAGRAGAQPMGTRADCMGIDHAQPLPVLACLRSFPNREQMLGPANGCGAVQGIWRLMVEHYGVRSDLHTPRSIPWCPVIARAIEIARGTPPVWADCVVLGKGAGTRKHIQDCLLRFVPGAYLGKTAASIRTCNELYEKYEMGLEYATPRAIIRPSTRTSRGNVDLRDNLVERYGPNPFDDPAVASSSGNRDYPVLRQRDCGIAEQVMGSLKAGPTGPAQASPAPNPAFQRSGASDIPTPTSPQNRVPGSPVTVPIPRIQ